MKVHPAPKKRNITLRYVVASALAEAKQKKLRRLPHIFAKVLELPFHADADVLVQETSDRFRFVVSTDDIGSEDIRAPHDRDLPGGHEDRDQRHRRSQSGCGRIGARHVEVPASLVDETGIGYCGV
ncbi:hypothetical protein Acr_17g0002980 [Actinidia rufa]|uniref:Uncharacterized protein n=1 Tax=Actinidia rufa TaxID=165716 RepID=A0A7J0G1R2_9ERIC|nr:hypothetical protein Acr_17g0002980 [Actinidia rufa]